MTSPFILTSLSMSIIRKLSNPCPLVLELTIRIQIPHIHGFLEIERLDFVNPSFSLHYKVWKIVIAVCVRLGTVIGKQVCGIAIEILTWALAVLSWRVCWSFVLP